MNDEYLHPLLFIISFILFTILKMITEYFELKLNLKSLIHTTIVLCVLLYLYITKKLPSINKLKDLSNQYPNTSIKNVIKKEISKNTQKTIHKLMIFSLVFSIYDIYIGLIQKRPDFIIHGILFFLFVFSAYYLNVFLYPYVIIIELSTIFYNFLYTKNIYIILAFIVTFFIARILYLNYFTYISYYYFYSVSFEYYLLILYLCVLNILNLFWFYKIICKSYKTFKQKNK